MSRNTCRISTVDGLGPAVLGRWARVIAALVAFSALSAGVTPASADDRPQRPAWAAVAQQTPAQQTPAQQTPAQQTPAQQTPAQQTGDKRPVVYLTFDSGPGPRTLEFLEVLAKWDATATFFVIGRNVQNNQRMLERIVEAGHAVGNHTWSHRNLAEMSTLEAQTELHLTNEAIKESVGLEPRCWRPPFGESSADLVRVAAREGLDNSAWIPSGRWSVDTVDWKYGYEFVLARLKTIQAGDVVLMHGGMNPDYEDLAALMTWLEANGDNYRFESLPGCVPTKAATSLSGSAAPSSLAAADVERDLLNTNLELWVQVQRGSTYLGSFGSTS